jgi:acetyl esterase/lipase
MTGFNITDWDNAYANGPNIPNGNNWPDAWVEPAARYRASAERNNSLKAGISYGSHERNCYDLFLPEAKPAGLFVFVHGGFWLKLDNSYWSHLAQGAVDSGWAVAMPSYALCPEVDIGQITKMIADAIEHAGKQVEGPIVLSGHSAGGHLVTSMLNKESLLEKSTQSRIVNTVSISGVHDLRPLMHTAMNETLKISEINAKLLSPALMSPMKPCRICAWVGGSERAEFIRQSELLANIWRGLGAWTECIVEPDRHHFDVIDALMDKDSALIKTHFDF